MLPCCPEKTSHFAKDHQTFEGWNSLAGNRSSSGCGRPKREKATDPDEEKGKRLKEQAKMNCHFGSINTLINVFIQLTGFWGFGVAGDDRNE